MYASNLVFIEGFDALGGALGTALPYLLAARGFGHRGAGCVGSVVVKMS